MRRLDRYPHVTYIEVDDDIGWIQVQHDGNVEWETLQKIKNDIWGQDAVAIEVYPPEDRVVNTGNWRHLWRLGKGEFYPDIKTNDVEGRDTTLAERLSFARGKCA